MKRGIWNVALCLLLVVIGAGCSVAVGGSLTIGRLPQPVEVGHPTDKPTPAPSPSPSPSPEGGRS